MQLSLSKKISSLSNIISIIITVIIIIAATPLSDEHSWVSCPTVVHWTISNCWLVFQAATVDSNQPCFLSSRSPIILVGLEPEMGNMSFPIQQIAPWHFSPPLERLSRFLLNLSTYKKWRRSLSMISTIARSWDYWIDGSRGQDRQRGCQQWGTGFKIPKPRKSPAAGLTSWSLDLSDLFVIHGGAGWNMQTRAKSPPTKALYHFLWNIQKRHSIILCYILLFLFIFWNLVFLSTRLYSV